MKQHLTIDDWPKIPRIVNEVGKRLQAKYGEKPIPAKIIKREIEKVGSYQRDSILPTDYCYNAINRARFSFQYPVFVRVRRGLYKYIGPNYPYTGSIVWKPRDEPERQVGMWNNGVYTLYTDPRSQTDS